MNNVAVNVAAAAWVAVDAVVPATDAADTAAYVVMVALQRSYC